MCRRARDHPYIATNGAGYTLQSLFGVVPNARAAPDFLGWELKTCRSDRITLMTTESDFGYYREHGVEAFVRNFGHVTANGTLYFTGQHRVGVRCVGTGQRLILRGFDSKEARITDVEGGIYLVADDGSDSAGWSFSRLLEHWGRKHAAAANVPCERQSGALTKYRFTGPVSLGEGTEFVHFLRALVDGVVVYDAGSKVVNAGSRSSKVKARSQSRTAKSRLQRPYDRFVDEDISQPE